jgi:hypothetical protein
LAEGEPAFEPGDGLVEVPFAEGYEADTITCTGKADRMIDRLG